MLNRCQRGIDLYTATKDSQYLSQARKIADAAVASSSLLMVSSSGILTESCEGDGNCNNDQQAFKGIVAYNLAKLDRTYPGERSYKGGVDSMGGGDVAE